MRSFALSLLLLGSVVVLVVKGTQAGHCFSCSNVQKTTNCIVSKQCAYNQDCYTERFGDLPYATFNLGCMDKTSCPRTPTSPFTLVGRAVTSAPVANCRKCCNSDRCNNELCDFNKSVDGKWNVWSSWSSCSVSCGRGTITRTRSCSNPRPANGGDNCVGRGNETNSCNPRDCPVHGKWSEWNPWGLCSEPCGIGLMNRHRTCTNPPPSLFGHFCYGDPTEYMICNTTDCLPPTAASTPTPHICVDTVQNCNVFNDTFGICADQKRARDICQKFCNLCGTVDGKWSAWSEWANCCVTCGSAMTYRARTCTDPSPINGGEDCQGTNKESSSCNLLDCPGWSAWTEWADCSSTCGMGLTNRRRSCTNPRPSLFGTFCFGDPVVYNLCMTGHCPVDGNWNEWGEWSECSRTCGQGTKTKVRSCSNPAPKYSGVVCQGQRTTGTSCGIQTCPVDGHWSSWSSWSACVDDCYRGMSNRNRTCTNPSPSGAGRQCLGNVYESRLCSCINGHAFKVLQSETVTYSGDTFLALEVRVPADGRSKTENWCRDYQLLCEQFSRRPTGCRVSYMSGNYLTCHQSFNSDMAIGDVLNCAANVAAVANAAFPHLSVPAKYGYNTFAFYDCRPGYCQKTIQASKLSLFSMPGFWGSGGTYTRIFYTVCH